MTNERGFSIVEVLVAIIILTVGLLALAQSSGAVTTMIGRGKQDTQASLAAQQQLERLRQVANSTSPKCTALASGTATGPATGTTTAWTVSGSGDSRSVAVTVTYRISRGTRTETIRAILGCL
ncbi:MAG TPA: prepilin-type N-terminal cleavage/methylation domain-containing protein [Gemmatimonadales bacterium]|nr:prepilin-type N-terminal cleavage/methylation domain-containing protein [Gemmatimonadales bacterium]